MARRSAWQRGLAVTASLSLFALAILRAQTGCDATESPTRDLATTATATAVDGVATATTAAEDAPATAAVAASASATATATAERIDAADFKLLPATKAGPIGDPDDPDFPWSDRAPTGVGLPGPPPTNQQNIPNAPPQKPQAQQLPQQAH